MDGPDLLAARLLRAMVADDIDAVAHLVVEIEDSGYAGLVATGLAQSYITEVLKTASFSGDQVYPLRVRAANCIDALRVSAGPG